MATYTFDGTSNVTATKSDTVIITADPTSFTQAQDNGSNVTLGFGSSTLTITGTSLTAAGLANVSLSGGKFTVLGTTTTGPGTTQNELAIVIPDGTQYTQTVTTVAASKVAVFGGLGLVDTVDGADSISVGGKGTFFIHGDGGGDSITNGVAAFDSTSVVNVFGDQGNDTVSFTASTKASIFVGGGAGTDSLSIATNTGTTYLTGGIDSTDGADTISYAVAGGASGTSYIYGNGGDDSITVGAAGAGASVDSTSTSTVFGGYGNDKIAAYGTKATLTLIGGEGADSITVVNTGNTFITGGNPSGSDQSLDGADTITVDTSGGNIAIFSNIGNDSVSAQTLADSTTIQIYGGKGSDTILQSNNTTTGKNSIFIAGGEDGDTITAAGNGGAVTIYGGISSSDSTDAADSITLNASTGTVNIYANGGNDTVSIGVLGTDTTNTVTVYGGGGADSITVAAQVNGNEALVLNGNEGPDTFSLAKGTGQTVTIADFKVSDGDSLKLSGVAAGTLQVTTGTFQTLQQALNAATTKAGAAGAAAVTFSGSTYVVEHTGGAATTFDPTADQAIKLTGVTDASTLVPVTTVTA